MKDSTYTNVWDALAATPAEAKILTWRSELMEAISAEVQRQGWKQTQAAQACGITQPRLNALLRGKISLFSLEALLEIALNLGLPVSLQNSGRKPPSRQRMKTEVKKNLALKGFCGASPLPKKEIADLRDLC